MIANLMKLVLYGASNSEKKLEGVAKLLFSATTKIKKNIFTLFRTIGVVLMPYRPFEKRFLPNCTMRGFQCADLPLVITVKLVAKTAVA